MSFNDLSAEEHMSKIGAGMWYLLHCYAYDAVDSEGREYFEHFLIILLKRIKCKKCKDDLEDFIEKHPLSKYKYKTSSKGLPIGYFKWSIKYHNHVNKKIGKPKIDVYEAYKYYSDFTECISCQYDLINL